jgi:hypothetical protein
MINETIRQKLDDCLALQRDSSVSPFFLRKSDQCVYCINIDCELQRIGSFESFMAFCLDQIIEGKNWYSSLTDAAIMEKYGLATGNAMD